MRLDILLVGILLNSQMNLKLSELEKINETELFNERHARGVPIILYWKDRGELRSRWSNFYTSFCGVVKLKQPYSKIIYLKTKQDQR